MKFGERETTIFTKIYIKQPSLWNQKHPENRLRHKRIHAYKEMIAEFYDATGMKLSEVEVQQKIRSLRSTYCQELQKIKRRSNADWTYVPTLKWFHEWHKHFAKDLKNTDDGIGGEIIDNNPDTIDTSQERIWVPQDELPDSLQDSTEDEDHKLIDLKPEPSDIDFTSTYKTRKRKYKNSNLDKNHINVNSSNVNHSNVNSSNVNHSNVNSSNVNQSNYIDSSCKEDEFDIYGKYIASQLRKMNTQKALRVQLEIQSLVSTARIEDMNGN